jgi:predicted transcriptional regulator of viral defense system
MYYNLYYVIMEKSEQEHKSYTNISRNESALMGVVEDADLSVFGMGELLSLTGWQRVRINNTLYSMEKKNLVTRVRRNSYTLTAWVDERLFEIATETVKPSYIGFWTALSRHGFTEQQPAVVQLVSTRQIGGFDIGPHAVQMTTCLPKRFYGYQKMGRFVIAEKEKVLVDSLYRPDKCGGLDEYAKCLRNSWEKLDKKKFLSYILCFGNKSIVSRAGFLVETLGLEGLAENIEDHIASGYVKLDPGGRETARYDHRWKVMVNFELEDTT